MNEPQEKVYIKLTALGNREQDVIAVLSRIQGLRDTPERLIADIPCYISDKVSLPLAEKVKMYLEKTGAHVTIEDENFHPIIEDDFLVLNEEEPPIFDKGDETSSFGEQNDSMPYNDAIEGIEHIPTVPASSQNIQEALSERQSVDGMAFEEKSEFSPPRKPSLKMKERLRSTTPFFFVGGLVVLLLVVGIWFFFRVQFTDFTPTSSDMGGRPAGVLDIRNPEAADLRLYHVVGTRVIKEVMFEGERVPLQSGDYYLEAQKGRQIEQFPVYIAGRGHRVTVSVEFPQKEAPTENLVYIPPGWFRMGNKETADVAHFGFPDEKPDIDVFVSGFFLSQYEVTNREFARFVQDGGYYNERYWERLIQDWPSLVQQVPSYGKVYGNNGWESVRRYIATRFVDTDERPGPRLWEADDPPYTYGHDDHPVFGISLYEAEAYCLWKTGQTGKIHRLPTEAEWEKAARGHEGYFFSYGNEYDPDRANTESEGTKPVGLYPPNSYGLYDMTGNVWEWVSDHYRPDTYHIWQELYRTDIRNPSIFDEDKRYDRAVVRGGSFRSVNRINARTPVRYPMFPNDWHTNIGFRYVVVP